MKKLKSLKTVLISTIIILFTLMISTGYCPDRSDDLKALLIDLKEWKAEKAEGSSVNMPGMKMITAIRSYSKGEMNLDVTILVGSSVILMGQTPEVSAETDEVKLTTSDIDGFKVIQAFDKSENGGYIVINIDKKETEGSLFMISYSGISSKEVLAIAKKFNWKKIKTTTGKLME